MDVLKTTWIQFTKKLSDILGLSEHQLQIYNVKDLDREFNGFEYITKNEQNQYLADFGLKNGCKYEFDVDDYILASGETEIRINFEGLKIIVKNNIRNVEMPVSKIQLENNWKIVSIHFIKIRPKHFLS